MVLSESGDVALTHVLDHFEKIGFYAKLGRLTRGISNTEGAASCAFSFATRQVITTFVRVSLAVGFGFKQFVGEHTVAPAAVVVQQCECNVVIPEALYLLALHLCHRCSSDYIFIPVGCRALVDPLLSFLSGSSR